MTHLYVSSMEDNFISVFSLASETGTLTRVEDFPVRGGPAPLATDPAERIVFVGHRSSSELSSFERDSGSGRLSPINTVALDADPCYLATDRTGRYLFSAYYGAGVAAVHWIESAGSVAAEPLEWRETAPRAHCMHADPSNRFVFVPHIANYGGANAIFQFRFDADTGNLSPNTPERVKADAYDGPRHFCFHPRRALLYCSNEQSSSMTVYRFDRAAGTLRPIQTCSNLPADFEGENTCSQVRITPGGRFLYAPNRGHDTIAVFRIDASSGRLQAVGHQMTEKEPRALGMDPDGRFLFVAGLETGRLVSYAIDAASGELSEREVHSIGKVAMWVLACTRQNPS